MRMRPYGSMVGGAIALLVLWMAAAAAPAPAQPCVGDCGGRGEVGVSDIVLAVNIVLGLAPADACPALGPPPIGIAHVIASIANALCACRPCPTAPPTPTAPPATASPSPTASPTPTAIAAHWREDMLRIPSSSCPQSLVTQLRRELATVSGGYTVRRQGDRVELVGDGDGDIPGATLDDQQVLRATVVQSDSEGACTVTVSLALRVDLSRSPTTATYDGRLTNRGCPRALDCRLTLTSRWTRTAPAAVRRADPASPLRALLRAAR